MINSATVQFSQQTDHDQNNGDFQYRLACKKPVDAYAFLQAQRYEDSLRKSKRVTYRGMKKASGRAKRKLLNAQNSHTKKKTP
jgi:hypothetical protein